MGKVFSTTEIERYKVGGYLLYHNQLFNPEALTKLTDIFGEHLAEKGARLSDELDTPHFRDQRLFEFLMAPNILDMVSDLLGPDIGLWSSHFISKEPFVGRRTPWHEDGAYWKDRFDRMDKMVTIWLAIDNSTLANGCMGVVPGTHLNGFSTYTNVDTKTSTFAEEIAPGTVDESKVVWFELKRGECSLHDGRIIHGAYANTSPYRRCGYTMRYFSLDMKYNTDHPGNKNHRIYYCRGNNVANNPLVYV